jgi:hypothetical protein
MILLLQTHLRIKAVWYGSHKVHTPSGPSFRLPSATYYVFVMFGMNVRIQTPSIKDSGPIPTDGSDGLDNQCSGGALQA